MAIQFGVNQINSPSPTWLKVLANTTIVVCMVVSTIIAPMPTDWISDAVKVYILTVTSTSGGLLKVIEKLTGIKVEN
jgi:hypothetical protein